MTDKSKKNYSFHSDDVAEGTSEEHGKSESPEGCSSNPTGFFAGEVELAYPDGH